ncbi:MAG: HAD-IC family P-type ATPase [Deltaproteobacteria bacterium]|nr:HAD-IC family P-type ATPase [Deltaproteobacteria bacterium]
MNLIDMLKCVIPGIKARDHEKVLAALSNGIAEASGGVKSKTMCDLLEHESMEGVLAGTKSAVFHCISEEVKETAVGMAISQREVPHPTKRRPVRIFFMIVSPMKESGTHLQLLSKIEGLLLDKAFHHAVLNARNENEVRDALRKSEGSARSYYVPLTREEVMGELETSPDGLTSAEAARREKLAGPNTIVRIRRGTLLIDFLHNLFTNLFAILLWAGGVMSFVAGMPELGWAIFMVIVINAAFSFLQEYKAEKAVEALTRLLPKKVRVVRDGAITEMDAEKLVPGDLILLSEGEAIPADGRLIEAADMRVDNSALTGESRPIYKIAEPVADGGAFIWTEVPNIVFAGTTVVSGEGRMFVTATGMNTEIGQVAYLTQAIRPEMSPLQKELVAVTRTVTLIAVSLGVAFFFLGWLAAGLGPAESFIFAIGIIVANVPEGLLPTVSLSLAMGVQRMARRGALIKKLSAVETLGSATVICTDKTGTLTQNRMTVEKLYVDGQTIDVSGNGYEPAGGFSIGQKSLDKTALEHSGATRLLTAAALCNNASLIAPDKKTDEWRISGDPTEGALIIAAMKAGLEPSKLQTAFRRAAQIPFERVRKRMTTIHAFGLPINEPAMPDATGRLIAFVKGSPYELAALCTHILRNGKVAPASRDEISALLKHNDEMASKGLRILAVAFREIDRAEKYAADDIECGLTMLGLIAMHDPPRPEVNSAVADCHSAGIRVIMVTGDYSLTAAAIAARIGVCPSGRVITGAQMNGLDHAALREILREGETIFARVEPKDKLMVVTALQSLGEVVAVTGDGVNDAPALKKADIGIAMGLRGSDAARESAEIILTDDNFSSIVEAVREGRAVYSNIKKFVTYIFASNIPEIVPFIAFVIFRIPLPLTVMQILAVDLGTDVMPALGLGVEPPEAGIMKQAPRPRTQRLLDWKTLALAYLFLGPIEAALCMAGFFFVYLASGWSPGLAMAETGTIYAAATTMSFAGIVATQIGNVFACRTERASVLRTGLFTNKLVLFGIAAEITLLLLLVYTPPLARIFGFAPLGIRDWALLASFPFILLAASEARKAVLRRRVA